MHTPEAGKAENKKKKYEEKGNLISTIMAMTDAAKREALSPQQAAKSVRRGDKSWLMLVQKEEADGLGVIVKKPRVINAFLSFISAFMNQKRERDNFEAFQTVL